MSLLVYRRQIAAAAIGALAPEEESSLRLHLGECERCRAYYDRLVITARALAGEVGHTRDELERERSRVLAALRPAPPPDFGRPRVFGPLGALFGAVVLFIVSPSAPDREQPPAVVASAQLAPAQLWVYAQSSGGASRLIGELSPSAEARAQWGERLRLAYASPEDGHLAVVAVGPKQARVLVASTPVRAARQPTMVGESFTIEPGVTRVFAVFARSPVDGPGLLRAAAAMAEGRTRSEGAPLAGVLVASP